MTLPLPHGTPSCCGNLRICRSLRCCGALPLPQPVPFRCMAAAQLPSVLSLRGRCHSTLAPAPCAATGRRLA